MAKRDDRIQTVDELAQEAFQNHVLRKEGDGRWFCGRPGTGMYHFRIIIAPACVFLYGDIGNAVFLCSEHDSLNWLLDSIDGGRDYILGKCGQARRDKDRWGWMPQNLWHYHALKTFCRLLDVHGKQELICGETDGR